MRFPQKHKSKQIISLNTINRLVFVINTDYSQCQTESKIFILRLDERLSAKS